MAGLPASAFISETIEEREIELGDGTKAVLFFKHLPNTVFEKYALWTQSADEDVVAAASARLLALGMCEPDGSTVLTQAQAEKLKRPVAVRLMRALLEVNGYGASGGTSSVGGAADPTGKP